MRVLIGRKSALRAWQWCISVRLQQFFVTSLLLLEWERVGTFLVSSCKSIVGELHTYTHMSGSRRILAFTLQVPCDPTLDQSTWQRREQRRPQQRHQPQRRRWRPQTSPPKVGSSNPEERFHILNQKKSWKIVSNLARSVFCPYSARLRQRFEQSRLLFWRSCFSL